MSVLLKFSRDWADEFQAEGFRIVDSEQTAQKIVEYAVQNGFSFGTNEGWEDEGELDSSDFSITPISDGKRAILIALFPGCEGQYGFGQVPNHVPRVDE